MRAMKEKQTEKLSKESIKLRTHILELLRTLKFGQVAIIIKNGKITQIEKTEKQRSTLKGLYGEGI